MDDKFNVLKFFSQEGENYPVPKRMCQRFHNDLPSEAVSESTFSTHAAFATDLRSSTAPDVISDMVYCHRNDALLWARIKGKVKDRYDEHVKKGKAPHREAARAANAMINISW